MRKPRQRPRYADIMSTIAVLLAMGGTAYAAATITGRNVKNNTLTGADIKDRSIAARDLARGLAAAGKQGPTGTAGATGAAGKDGVAGKNGTNGTNGTAGVAGPTGPAGAAHISYVGKLTNGPVSSDGGTVVLSDATFGQAADELVPLYGRATISSAQGGACNTGGPIPVSGFPSLIVAVDGAQIVFTSQSGSAELPLATRFPTGAAGTRTVTATFSDSCPDAAHFDLTALEIYAVGAQP